MTLEAWSKVEVNFCGLLFHPYASHLEFSSGWGPDFSLGWDLADLDQISLLGGIHWSFSFLLFKNPFKRSHSLFCLIIIPISCHRWSLNKVCSCLPRNPRPRVDRPRRHPLHGGPPRKQRRRGPARDRLVRPARAQPGRVRLLVGRRQELEEDQVRSINIITMSQYVFLVMG